MDHNHDLAMDGGSQRTQERNHSLPLQREHHNHASGSNMGEHNKTTYPLGGLKIGMPKESNEKSVSIVVESIMERPTSSRQPTSWNTGFQFLIVVDALLVDMANVDDFAIQR
ncbi:hypothetical protein GOP47_0030601 [Adiantum capillus-veneris]|nr:hypothetical protein GOP47_0030601 [Adiantum capillus-veneris]